MRGIRARTAAIAAVSVAVVLLVGVVAFTSAMHEDLLDQLDSTLEAQALDRASLVAGGATPADLTNSALHESLVWIGTRNGLTLASAGTVVVDGAPAGTATGTRTVEVAHLEADGEGGSEHEVESMRVATVAALNPDGDTVLISVGSELDSVAEPVREMRFLLLLGLPALVALTAGLVWFGVGRALRPVEAIRAAAAKVKGGDRDHRVPVPAGSDEIVRLATTVNRMLDRLADHHDRSERFAEEISTGLREPVEELRTELENATIDDAAWPAVRDDLTARADHLQAVIDDLAALAAPVVDPQADFDTVDLDELVMAEAAAASRRSGLDIDMWDVDPVRVDGDDETLRRAVRNLLDNAVRHARRRVRVEVHRGERGVDVSVADDGDGIPPEQRAAVLERFTRLDDERTQTEMGTGLGLAIVKDAMDRHGGAVELGDADLGGALVTLHLPLEPAGR